MSAYSQKRTLERMLETRHSGPFRAFASPLGGTLKLRCEPFFATILLQEYVLPRSLGKGYSKGER